MVFPTKVLMLYGSFPAPSTPDPSPGLINKTFLSRGECVTAENGAEMRFSGPRLRIRVRMLKTQPYGTTANTVCTQSDGY